MYYPISDGVVQIDENDLSFIDQWDWKISERGYAITIHGNIKMHMLLCPNNDVVHHINENKLNNKRNNLKGLSNSEHRKIHSKDLWKKSKYPGACFNNTKNPEKKCWQVQIQKDGWIKRLGYFEDPITASMVYKIVRGEIDEMG